MQIRDWDREIETARRDRAFTPEAKRDATDFRFCLIGERNRQLDRELQKEYSFLEDLGYVFCEAVCRDQVDLAEFTKKAVDGFINRCVRGNTNG